MEDFVWSDEKEPHFMRRKEIMKEFPEVKKLFGHDSKLIYKTLFVAALQLSVPLFFLPENPPQDPKPEPGHCDTSAESGASRCLFTGTQKKKSKKAKKSSKSKKARK